MENSGSTDGGDGESSDDAAGAAGDIGGNDAGGSTSGSASQGDGSGGETGAAGSYNVYQVMNRNDSDTQRTLDYDNPWRRAVVPAGCLFLVLGGIESWQWYRWQRRPTWMP